MKLSSNTTTFYGLFNSCFSLIIWSLFDAFRLTFHFCDAFAVAVSFFFIDGQSENDLHPKCNKHLTLLLPIQLSMSLQNSFYSSKRESFRFLSVPCFASLIFFPFFLSKT